MRLLALIPLLWVLSGSPALADPASAIVGIATFVGKLSATQLALLQLGASVTFTYLSRALRGKPEAQEPVGGRFVEYTYGEAKSPLRVVLGYYAVRGHALGPPYSSRMEASGGSGGAPNKFLLRPTILSDMPIEEMLYCVVDGEDQYFDSSGVGGRSFRIADLKKGPNSETSSAMLANFSGEAERPWQSDMIGRDMAWIAPQYHTGVDEEDQRWGGSPPLPLWVLQGARLLDPRTGETVYTENPVVMIWNILRGITIPAVGVWGLGVPEDELPAAHWAAAMDVCDEISPGGERRYRAGLEFGLDEEPLDVIQEFLRACGGEIADCGGEWRIAVGPPAPSVYDFTDDQVSVTDSRSFRPFEGLDSTFNGVSAKYLDPRNGWEPTEAVPYINLEWEEEDGGRRQHADLDLSAVPFPSQVRRLMRELGKDNRRMRIHEITLGPAALHVMPLDTVRWTSAENGYITKLFEVLEKAIDPVTLNSVVLIRERDPSDYDWDQDFDDILPFPPSRVNEDRTIHGVEGFNAVGSSIVDSEGVDRRPCALCTWSVRDSDGLEIEITHPTSGQHIITQQLGPGAVNVGQARITADGLLPSVQYSARPRLIMVDRPTTWGSGVLFTTPGVYLKYKDFDATIAATIDQLEADRDAMSEELAAVIGLGEEVVLRAVSVNGRVRLRYFTLDGDPIPGDVVVHGDVALAPGSIFAPLMAANSITAQNGAIANLTVGTLKIIDGAVSENIGLVYGGGHVHEAHHAPSVILTAPVTLSGGPVIFQISFGVQHRQNSGVATCQMVRSDGVVVGGISITVPDTANWEGVNSDMRADLGGVTGNYTYRLQVTTSSNLEVMITGGSMTILHLRK